MALGQTEGKSDAPDLNDRVDVWLCRDEKVSSHQMEWLDAEELTRFNRFRADSDRRLFAVAHVFLRQTLSRSGPWQPRDGRVVRGEFSRPELAPPFDAGGLRFNLSHTRGLVAVVITRNLDCGIDVEKRNRDLDLAQVSRAAFAESERSEMLALAPTDQRRRFFELWTLKESYIKARGMGLALPLKQFAFYLPKNLSDNETEPISIAVEPPIEDRPEDWQFELFSPTTEHQLALSLRRGHQGHVPNLSWSSLEGETPSVPVARTVPAANVAGVGVIP